MNIVKKIIGLACIGLLSYGLSSCNNEDDATINAVAGLEVNADLLKLTDNGTNIAGELSIASSSKDIQLIWNTDSICNLDTTLTSISPKNGRYVLPIKWQKHLTDSTFAPKNIAYKAGLKIVAGENSKYIPLIWAEKIDTTKVMESILQTRAADNPMPKVTQITMTPSTVNMNDENGGTMYIGLSNVPFVIFDWSDFTSDMNIDMSAMPTSIQTSTMLNFKWKSGGAPAFEFSANVIAMSEGLTQIGVVEYKKAPVPPATLEVNPSSHTVSAMGQTVYSSVNSNKTWTVTSNVPWITSTATSSTQLSFVVAQNTSTAMRTGTVTVTAGSLSRTVSFTQQGAQQTYRVYYNANGGSFTPSDNNTYTAGATVYVASAINRYGYTFAGWRRSDNGSVIAANSAFVMLATDVTLTAQWVSTKSSFRGTVTNCSNVQITGGGRWITGINAVYGEYTAITATFNNVQIAGGKFSRNGDGTVTIQPGRYRVRFNGTFNLGNYAAGGAVYLASARDQYFRANISAALPLCAYFKWHLNIDNTGGAIVSDPFIGQGSIVTISSATTIRCDAQIVGQNRPWGWTTGWLTISGMEITEL